MANSSSLMTFSRLLLLINVVFWLIIGGAVVRANRLWFGPVTFRWHNLRQPSAMFRWSVAPAAGPIRLDANRNYAFKIQVPKKFSTATLSIVTTENSGHLDVNVKAPPGNTNLMATSSGHNVTLSLPWENIAVQTRTFNVDVMAVTAPVTIAAISLSLQP